MSDAYIRGQAWVLVHTTVGVQFRLTYVRSREQCLRRIVRLGFLSIPQLVFSLDLRMSDLVSNAYVGGQAWVLVHATVGVQFRLTYVLCS